MLLKINYTNESSNWLPIHRGVAVYFCVSFPQSWSVSCVVLFLSIRCLKYHYLCSHVLSKKLTKSLCVWPSVPLCPLLVQLSWPHPCAAALLHFSILSCLCFYVAFSFSLLPAVMSSLCIFPSASALSHVGETVYLWEIILFCHQKNQPPPQALLV